MPEPRKRGEIGAAIDQVLARRAEGLPLAEIRTAVEALIGPVPFASIRAQLTRNASTTQERRSTRYELLGRGRYRLNGSDGYEPFVELLLELEAFGAGLRIEPLGEEFWQITYTQDGIDQRMLAKGRSINATAETALDALLHEMAGVRRLWLITGVPATGKTCFGNYLADEHGFVHLDFETAAGREGFERAMRGGLDVSISWGFLPVEDMHTIQRMRQLGFRWFWFDGDRDAAHRAFTARGTVSEEAWTAQLLRINEHIDPHIGELDLERVDVFDAAKAHRASAEIWSEIAG